MNARRAAGVVLLVVVVGCAETTVDTQPSVTTDPLSGDGTLVTVAATAPSGTTTELGAALVAEARGLSDKIVDGEGQVEALSRLRARWDALRPDVEAANPDLLASFEVAIELAANGVERRRPADADKASNNLATLVDALAAN